MQVYFAWLLASRVQSLARSKVRFQLFCRLPKLETTRSREEEDVQFLCLTSCIVLVIGFTEVNLKAKI